MNSREKNYMAAFSELLYTTRGPKVVSPSPSELEATLPRFGPIYGEDNKANQIAKILAWEHILRHDSANSYFSCIMKIEAEAMKSCDNTYIEKLRPGSQFRKMMVRDGCFFLQLALHILGGGEHLEYSSQHPYFGKGTDTGQWMDAIFFVGNQVPYVVIRALMKQAFFQNVIRKGLESGAWRRQPDELAKLALYRTVVEPELEQRGGGLSVHFSRPPPLLREPPSNILHYLHALFLGPGSDDPVYSKMKKFPDTKAGDDITFPSAGELLQSGIRLRKTINGITNIRLRNLGIFACLDVPPLTIDGNTEFVLRNLITYEQNLNECDREVTAYLHFMRDLAPTYKDFKILERSGIIRVNFCNASKYTVFVSLNELVASRKRNFTLNFRNTRRMIADYEKPTWGLITFIFGVLTVLQTILTFLRYFVAIN